MVLGVPILNHFKVLVGNHVDPDEAAHYEPPHPNISCLQMNLQCNLSSTATHRTAKSGCCIKVTVMEGQNI